MITRRAVVLAAVLATGLAAAFARPARAADSGAKGFVETIYNAYKGKGSKGISLAGDAAVRRYFEPKLAALIIRDQKEAARHGDAPTLDGDPFINAQDWDIKAVDIAMHDVTPDKAGATVSFRNLDVMTTVELDLVRLHEGWRIADITWDGNQTLRGMFGKP
jgi:hypothetical protein